MKMKNALFALLATFAIVGCGNQVSSAVSTTSNNPTTTTTTSTATSKTTTTTTTSKTTTTTSVSTSQNTSSSQGGISTPVVCEHNYSRTGTLKATSVTKGSKIEICDKCKDVKTTELDYDPNNSAQLKSSEQDAEINNFDLVRGLSGDFTLKFKYNNRTLNQNSPWNNARVVLLSDDTEKYSGGTKIIYGKALASPNDAGVWNGARYVGYSSNATNCWMNRDGVNDTFEKHAANMDVEVEFVRRGDFAHVYLDGRSKIDSEYSNHNEFHFYIPAEKNMNVVVGTTFAEVDLLEASLTLESETEVATKTEQLVTQPIIFDGDSAAYSSQQKILQSELKGERTRVTYKFNTSSSTAKDNSWGSWRASIWGNHVKNQDGTIRSPHPYNEINPETGKSNVESGSLFARLTAVTDDWTNWNGMNCYTHSSINWFASPTQTSGFVFNNLMMDCDVTLTVEKFGSYIFVKAHYATRLNDETYATKYYAGRVPEIATDHVSFSLDGEKSNIIVTSCVVENF